MRQPHHRSVATARRYLRTPELWRDNVTTDLLDGRQAAISATPRVETMPPRC